jgi:hypothetical protein
MAKLEEYWDFRILGNESPYPRDEFNPRQGTGVGDIALAKDCFIFFLPLPEGP